MQEEKFKEPNIFIFKNFSNEDHFTNSIAYILNLFKEELGNKFLGKIAILSGVNPEKLGKFEYAKFTGYHKMHSDSSSKPDMIIKTSTTKIFFEIKLEAPLSKQQLERHFADAERQKGYLILISNKKTKVSPEIINSKKYLKPRDHDHFYWSQIEPIFRNNSRKNSLRWSLLEDFKKSLSKNEIKGRQLTGYNGSLYDNGSEAQRFALNHLSEILKEIGFKIWKFPKEYTIRVYPEKIKERPLLNPVFHVTGEHLDEIKCTEECIITYCFLNSSFKMKKNKNLDLLLDKYKKSEIFDDDNEVAIYLPLKFSREGVFSEIDWGYLKKFFNDLFIILKG